MPKKYPGIVGWTAIILKKNLQNPLTLLDKDAKIQLKTTAASTDKQRRRLPCEP
jgi:hypothetical protein